MRLVRMLAVLLVIAAALSMAAIFLNAQSMGWQPPWVDRGIELTGEPEIGVAYRVSVFTHCGLRHVEFDGSQWAISGALSDGSGNPPRGFGNPTDEGTLTLTTPDTAVYRSQYGTERQLTRGGGLPYLEDCV